MPTSRTSLLVRLSHEDAARIRKEATSERRTVSAYLLRVLDRSIRIELKGTQGLSPDLLSTRARELIGPQNKKLHTAILLCCTVDEAAAIRECAARRLLSIGDFVVFSLRRRWMAMSQLEGWDLYQKPDSP